MSRFEQNSEIFDKQTWEDFRDKVTDISPIASPPPNKDEVDRFAKVTTAIADTVESAQPFADFMDPSLSSRFKSFENIINTLHSGNLFQQISSLNNTLTVILPIIWPFVSKSDAARAAGQAVRRYRKLIEEEETEISKMRTDADTACASISDINSISKEYHQELFEGTDQKASIRSEIETAASKIDEMFEETSTFYRRLTQGDAESTSIQNDILKAQEAAHDDSSKIAELLLETENKLKELNRIYSEVVGKDENSKGHDENSKGLKAQLYDRREQLNAMVEDYEEKIKNLYEKIEGLLPGATSAGLASAYQDLKKAAEIKTARYSTTFFAFIIILIIIAAMSITESFSIWPLAWETIRVSNLTEFLEKSLIRLPIIVPVVWAALTVSKRRSEMHRLAEEYAHKEALAKSYEGFKQQIIDMDIDTKAMLAELLEVLLKAVSLNAARTLDGKHGDKMPVHEAIEKAMKNATKQISEQQN